MICKKLWNISHETNGRSNDATMEPKRGQKGSHAVIAKDTEKKDADEKIYQERRKATREEGKMSQIIRMTRIKAMPFQQSIFMNMISIVRVFQTFSQAFLCFDRYWPRCTLRIHNLMESSTFYNDKWLIGMRPIKVQLVTVNFYNGSCFHETTKS